MLTYRELLEKLQTLNEDQLAGNVTVYAAWDSEYIPVERLIFAGEENDVLDENHPILDLAEDLAVGAGGDDCGRGERGAAFDIISKARRNIAWALDAHAAAAVAKERERCAQIALKAKYQANDREYPDLEGQADGIIDDIRSGSTK